jgi:hypothetical protein
MVVEEADDGRHRIAVFVEKGGRYAQHEGAVAEEYDSGLGVDAVEIARL